MMSKDFGRAGVAAALCLLALALPGSALAQRANVSPDQAARPLGVAEIQRLFDAYTVVQAQEALALDDAQFGKFLPRLKALQAARRRFEIERQRLTAELGRMLSPGPADEGRLREQLKALEDLEVRAAADAKTALDAVDQVLDLRQQARFRVFELQMERRKFELVLRARRGDAGRVPRDRD